MAGYIVRRCLYAILILVGVNLLTFTLFFAVNSPDNIARLNIGGKRVTAEARLTRQSPTAEMTATEKYPSPRVVS